MKSLVWDVVTYKLVEPESIWPCPKDKHDFVNEIFARAQFEYLAVIIYLKCLNKMPAIFMEGCLIWILLKIVVFWFQLAKLAKYQFNNTQALVQGNN